MMEEPLMELIERYREGDVGRAILKDKIAFDNAQLCEQRATRVEKLSDEYTCPRLPHPAGMSSCDHCDGHQDGMYLAAQIVRGQK